MPEQKPSLPEAHSGTLAQALCLLQIGQLQQAAQVLQSALQETPDASALHDALAVVRFQQQDYVASLQHMHEVLRLSEYSTFTAWPAWAQSAWYGVASSETVAQFRARIWRNIGACHLCLTQPQMAEQAFARAHDLAPQEVASTLYHLGQSMANCEWSDWPHLSEHAVHQVQQARPQDDLSASIVLFGAALQAAQMQVLSAQVSRSLQASLDISQVISSIPLREDAACSRLRVGYFSCDFRNHSVGQLTQSLYALHERERFEVFVLSYGADDGGAVRQTIAQGAEHFVELRGIPVLEMVQRIRKLKLDVVIDLSGHTAGALPQVMHYRVAPIQGHWLGYLWSMGTKAYDYVIADGFSAPAQFHPYYAEALVQLPHSLQIVPGNWIHLGPGKSREALGLRDDAFVMAYFGVLSKIQPPMFDAWLQVLKDAPHAVLWIARTAHSSAEAFGRLRLRSMQMGVNPVQIMFSDPVPHAEHLARFSAVDVMLDPFPVGSGVTALEALWMGRPMVSMAAAGQTLVSRMPGGVLHSAGLGDWVVDSLAAYQALLKELATDRKRCASAREHLMHHRDQLPIFDTTARVRQLEFAYKQMLRQALASQPPQSFAVSA